MTQSSHVSSPWGSLAGTQPRLLVCTWLPWAQRQWEPHQRPRDGEQGPGDVRPALRPSPFGRKACVCWGSCLAPALLSVTYIFCPECLQVLFRDLAAWFWNIVYSPPAGGTSERHQGVNADQRTHAHPSCLLDRKDPGAQAKRTSPHFQPFPPNVMCFMKDLGPSSPQARRPQGPPSGRPWRD